MKISFSNEMLATVTGIEQMLKSVILVFSHTAVFCYEKKLDWVTAWSFSVV